MATQRIRVGTWNLHWGRADASLIDGTGIELLALQEVTPDAFERFRRHFDWGFHAGAAEVLESHSSTTRYAPAIVGTARFSPRRRPLLDHLVAPDKLLVVDLRLAEAAGFFSFASYHALNGECGPDGFDKPRLTFQVAEWLEREPGPIVLGMDANSPWVDHPDHDQVECCFDWLGPRHLERALLGPEARHRLRDVLRTWLADRPDDLESIVAERPQGPLCVSHRTGRHAPDAPPTAGVGRRYDHIYATYPDFRVVDVEYRYEDAWKAGSDHALVVADLEVSCADAFAHTGAWLDPTPPPALPWNGSPT